MIKKLQSIFSIVFFVSLQSVAEDRLPVFTTQDDSYSDLLSQFFSFENRYFDLEEKVKQLEKERGVLPSICQGRLTITSGAPFTQNLGSQTTLYFTPYRGNKIALYDGLSWRMHHFSEISITNASLSVSTMYDVFIYNNSGTLTLEFSSGWTTGTVRANALVTQDGIYVKSGAPTRRYLGSVYSSSAGTFYDAFGNRLVWNNCNRSTSIFAATQTTDSSTSSSTSWGQYLGGSMTAGFVIGLDDVLVTTRGLGIIGPAAAATGVSVGLGNNTGLGVHSSLMGGQANTIHTTQLWADYEGYPGIGRRAFYTNQITDGSNTVTFYGDNGGTNLAAGSIGIIWGG